MSAAVRVVPAWLPCTSFASGARVVANTAAIFYVNSGTFAAGDGSATCGDADATPANSDECDVELGDWDQLAATDPRYAQACTEAWAYLRSIGIVDVNGTLDQAVIDESRAILDGTLLKNPQVIAILTADGTTMADWEKASTDTFPGNPFYAPYQLHFYRTKTTPRRANTTIDFKVKFLQPF